MQALFPHFTDMFASRLPDTLKQSLKYTGEIQPK